jgi:hypothetical protein
MKYGEILKSDKINRSQCAERTYKQSVGAVKKGAMVVKDKTGYLTREGGAAAGSTREQIKKTIKKIFKKAA